MACIFLVHALVCESILSLCFVSAIASVIDERSFFITPFAVAFGFVFGLRGRRKDDFLYKCCGSIGGCEFFLQVLCYLR
jgi:hypothetical protein